VEESMKDAPIAIVGLSYRAPGVGRKGLWEFLADAKSAWSKVPADRFDQDAYYHPNGDKAGCVMSKGGHFLPDDVFAFDAPFFNLRPEEARAVDPHHRMMLECALEAAENAGLSLLDLAGANIGVFAAMGSPEYGQQGSEDLPSTTTWTATGTAPCMFANRLSYFFDLCGPSISLDAACASSSYAIHIACQSLRAGECKAAFVGSSSLLLGAGQWSLLDNMGALSPEGKSFSYDVKASGFGRGEGGACLILKPLDEAIKDGDPVQAVIRNSACNHAGRSEGITMPRRSTQERLLRKVHEEIGLDPSDTPVVEGHGTGTKAGDPIEAGSFATVLGSKRTPLDPLYIGSLKSNFGHLEGASGILGVVKAILMIQHGRVLPQANFEKMNPNIDGREKLEVCLPLGNGINKRGIDMQPRWHERQFPGPQTRPSGSNSESQGFGGSNAVVILEEAPTASHLSNGHANATAKANGVKCTNGVQVNGFQANCTDLSDTPASNGLVHGALDHDSGRQLFVLSAKSEGSLMSYIDSFREYLEDLPDYDGIARDLSFTLGQRRTHHPYRVTAVADSMDTLKSKLLTSKVHKVKERIIAFAFTGQGAQHAQMASGLERYREFAAAIDQAELHLREMGAPWSLKEELGRPDPESSINDAELSQPACTAVQLALVVLLRSWGVIPATVFGHSSGEIAAAFAAGLISFKAAIAIAFFRGQAAAQLVQKNSQKGTMLALGISCEAASTLLEQNTNGYATVAAINSPSSVTVSGDEPAIENIQRIAEGQGLFARRLKVGVAYHSRHMEEIAASYLNSIKPFCNVGSEDYHARFVSSVTGSIVNTGGLDASYWVINLLQPVRFVDAIENVFLSQNEKAPTGQQAIKLPNVIVEVGPHGALKNPIKQTLEELRERTDQRQTQITYLPSLMRGTSSEETLLTLAGSLFTLGSSIQFAAINQTNQHNAHVLTDLPPYTWDKSSRYTFKSRIAQQKIHPGQPYDSLIGWKSPYTEGGEHAFRQVFTLDEMPWIRDHHVSGTAMFPMTGYLSMAIEAVRRVSPTKPSSILVWEFHAKRSLGIEEDERVDITTKLRPAVTGTENFSSTAWFFEILTWSEEHGWTLHCHGIIEPEMAEMTLESPTIKGSLPFTAHVNMIERDPKHEYDAAQECGGTRYGPTFKTMVKIWEGPGCTVMESELRDLDLSMPSRYGSLASVDPPTLDSFLQGPGPLQEVAGKSALVPNYVSRLRISNNIPTCAAQRFTIVTRLLDYDTKAGRLRISVAVFTQSSDSFTPVAEWECVTFRIIGSLDDGNLTSNLPASYYWDLIPCLDFIDNDELARILEVKPFDPHQPPFRRQMNRVAVYYVERALKETANDDISQWPIHLSRFFKWAEKMVLREEHVSDNEALSLLAEVSNSGARGKMLCAVGEQLSSILRSEVQPLEIMLKDNMLSGHYEADIANAQCSQVLARCVRHLSDVNPDLRILEIGAGTGSATLTVLQELSRGTEKLPAFSSYTFTDISPGFFENAREKLAQWSDRITFTKLDISQDPVQQGFAIEDYDLVIASNVLHATPNMASTIDHVRSLMKPNGKLLALEAVCHPPLGLPFMVLPGWWLSEDKYRSHGEGCLMSEDVWHRLLIDRGFSGVDAAIGDYPDDSEHMLSVMCTTRVGIQEDGPSTAPITICGPLMDSEEENFAQMVADHVADRLGCSTSVKPFVEIDVEDDSFCIFIDSPRHSVLSNVSEESFEAFKTILLETSGLLWVVPENHPPEAQSMKGMLRTLRLEDTSKNMLLLESAPCTSEGATAVTKIAERLRDPEVARGVDQDFVWDKGMIHLPRFRPLIEAKEVFASEAGVPLQKIQNIWKDNAALELTVSAAGSPDSIYFRRTKILEESLGDEEVLIRVEAAGMNFRDLLLILGSIPWGPPGFEGAGVIVRTGSRVTDLKSGDRVFFGALGGGSYSTFVRKHSLDICKIPDDISTADAASISVAYSTAVMTLLRIARLRKGESVLIHAASGASDKREFLQESFSIPKEHIFSSRTPEFRDGILCATDGKGVDVIVNSLAGNLLQETWGLIAEFGRFVEIGKRDLLNNSHLGMRPFDRNVAFTGVDLRAYFEKRPEEMRECLSDVVDLMRRQVIVPIRPVTILPVSQIATGLRKLQSGQNVGKIVVTMDPDEYVLAECPPPPGIPSGQLLRPDATYVITGGTGGIGLSLGPWMVENGALNVVLLGRSGSSRPEVQKVLQEYEGTDVCMRAIACDVGSHEDLLNAVQSIRDLPPVKGVVHGALYLRDTFLVNATHEHWQDITTPRVRGAWNLHELLPDLDFFVSLSSFLGAVGNVGQSIYAGTANFFDAFTKYRHDLGLPAVSIALPVVLDVGYVAEHDLTEKLKNSLGATITAPHLRTLVKGAIVGPTSGLNRDGKSFSFSFDSGDDRSLLPWQCFHPRSLVHRINAENRNLKTNGAGQGRDARSTGWRYSSGGDPLLSLLDALITKVSSITMIDRDEVEPDAPLSTYSLDSLVSVELRNWIRRETGVELSLNKIVSADNLRALATHILSQRDMKPATRYGSLPQAVIDKHPNFRAANPPLQSCYSKVTSLEEIPRKGRKMDNGDPLLSELCTICHVNPPKYRCPRCSTRTCSLPCTRRHKLWSQCSGVRDPAAYLRRNELASESAFDRDFNFITGIERSLERADRDSENRGIELARGSTLDTAEGEGASPGADSGVQGSSVVAGRKRKHPHQGLVKGEAGFLRGAEAGGVRVVRAPRGMSRNKMNHSRWHPKHKCLSWTVEWISADGVKTPRNTLETCPVAEAYDRAFPPPRQSKSASDPEKEEKVDSEQSESVSQSHKQTPVPDTPAPSTTTEKPTETNPPQTSGSEAALATEEEKPVDSTIKPHRDHYFYLHRPRTMSKKLVLVPLPPLESVVAVLRNRTVLEFPTIYVLPESPQTLLAEKDTSRFVLEEEYLRTAGPEETSADTVEAAQESTGPDNDDTAPDQSVYLQNVDENKVMEVLKQDLFEPIPETEPTS
ncbi:polyketide synthase, partial [Penicillium alfredii]